MTENRVTMMFLATMLVNVVLVLPSSAEQREPSMNALPYARMVRTQVESLPAAAQPVDPGWGELVRLHLEIIRVAIPLEQVGALETASGRQNVDRLVGETLSRGKGDVRYVFDTPVRVGCQLCVQRLSYVTRTPRLVGSGISETRQQRTAVQFEDIGCSIEFRAEWAESVPARQVAGDWKIKITDLSDSVEAEQAPTLVRAGQDFCTRTSLGEDTSFYILSNPIVSGQPPGEATVYACRIRFDQKKPE